MKLPRDLLELIDRGLFLFPIGRSSKRPIVKWTIEATDDQNQIEKWAKQHPGCNWGVHCGKSNLLVVDVDGLIGEQSLKEMDLLYPNLPETFAVRTPNGRHLYYEGKSRNRTHLYAKGSHIDIRSVGGYVVAPGSAKKEKKYKIENNVDFVPAPEWLLTLIGQSKSGTVKNPESPYKAEMQKAKDYLSRADPAIEGSGGNSHTYQILARLRDFGLQNEQAASLVFGSEWNSRCEPPWDYEELLTLADNVDKYARSSPGTKTAEADFDVVDDSIWVEGEDGGGEGGKDFIHKLNKRYAKGLIGKKTVVMAKKMNNLWVPLPINEFKHYLQHKKVTLAGPKGKAVELSWAEYFLDHPDMMLFSELILDSSLPPGLQHKEGPFNLWTGFNIEPVPGDWTPYKRLIRGSISKGSKTIEEYILNWFAYLVQNPSLTPGVAMVFRGKKGIGKSTLAFAISEILKRHSVVLDSLKDLTSSFNGYIQDKVYVIAEEVKWKEHQSGESILKTLITGSDRLYQSKFIDQEMGKNCVSLIVLSNADWVVPASSDERRFAVFDVDDTFKWDEGMWDSIYNANRTFKLEPLAAFFDHLLKRDISDFRLKYVPQTKALADQKLHTRESIRDWLIDCIIMGTIGGWPWDDEPVRVPLSELYLSYLGFRNMRQTVQTRRAFGGKLKTEYKFKSGRSGSGEKRDYYFEAPPIGVVQEIIEAQVGQKLGALYDESDDEDG